MVTPEGHPKLRKNTFALKDICRIHSFPFYCNGLARDAALAGTFYLSCAWTSCWTPINLMALPPPPTCRRHQGQSPISPSLFASSYRCRNRFLFQETKILSFDPTRYSKAHCAKRISPPPVDTPTASTAPSTTSFKDCPSHCYYPS
jgi:hypothetical protein